jgi:hypothetical protein
MEQPKNLNLFAVYAIDNHKGSPCNYKLTGSCDSASSANLRCLSEQPCLPGYLARNTNSGGWLIRCNKFQLLYPVELGEFRPDYLQSL